MQRVSMVSAKVSSGRDNIASVRRPSVGAVREPPTTGAVNCPRASTAGLRCVSHIDDDITGAGTVGNANYATHPVGAVREPPTTRAGNCARSSTASLPCVAHIDDNLAGTGIVGNANCAMHPVGAVREPPAFGATTFQICLSACAGE